MTVDFKPGTDATYTFPAAPDGYVYGPVTVYAKGGDGGTGANGGSAGLGATAGVVLGVQPGARLHVIVGTTGSAGDPAEKEPGPGGFPGGGDGVQGGGGGGGYSAVCGGGVDPETDPAVSQNCYVVGAGGGGSGGQPAMAAGARSGAGGDGFTGDAGEDGAPEASAGPGRGGGGEQSGAGGSAGAGDDAHPGERGLPGQGLQGGAGGIGGTDGGGGGGGGGGATGGQGGGGGGSCSVNEQSACPDGYAGGGGGSGGVSITRGPLITGNGAAYVTITITQTPIAATASPTPVAQTGPPAAAAGAATSAGGGEGVSVPLTCAGAPGGSCDLQAGVSTTTKAGKRLAVTAKRRARRHTVRIGLIAVALRTGQAQTVTVQLDRTGRRLLERRKHLAVRLTVTQRSGGKATVVHRAKLTLRKS